MRTNKTIFIIIGVFVVLVAGGALAIALSQDSHSGHSHQHGTGTSSNGLAGRTSSREDAQPTTTNKVTISNFAFSPSEITVEKGTTVTWTNEGDTDHTVTADDSDGGPNSGSLSNGQTYSFTFNRAGTFEYHCNFHSSMTGKVTVTD